MISSTGSIVTEGRLDRLEIIPGMSIAGAVHASLTEISSREAALVMGALPFDPEKPPQLYRPSSIRRISSPGHLSKHGPAYAGDNWHVTSLPSPAQHAENVRHALSMLVADGQVGLHKVVLARSLLCEAPRPIDLAMVLDRLRQDPDVTAFLVPLPSIEAPRFLIGATPELLVGKHGSRISSSPLAGSARRGGDVAADRLAAEGLRASFKDGREHAAVVEAILDTLSPYCSTLAAGQRDMVSTATMFHLRTPIEGVLRDEAVSVMELVEALHPTPAVCGSPRDKARAVIADLEPFDRGFYGGAVGWCDAAGDGEWFVAIRCGEISGPVARLYAGGGLVLGSDPEAELAETSAKFQTLLRALGIDETGRPVDELP